MPRRPARRSPSLDIDVLRLGHRAGRDPRLTTHVALAARALGARRLFLEPPDPALSERLRAVGARWGGAFAVEGVRDWRRLVREYPGVVVHLTMYGRPLAEVRRRLPRTGPLLLVVGGAKVPSEMYARATLNVAVGHQPHSEVAALAVVLAELLGVPGPGPWPGATHAIVPRARGKAVRSVRGGSPAR
jgi:tRNA (cytidine56-2'-O)-methyltransferase